MTWSKVFDAQPDPHLVHLTVSLDFSSNNRRTGAQSAKGARHDPARIARRSRPGQPGVAANSEVPLTG
jgi:hypothetical protein